jgi:hypothetical protein
MAWLLEEDWRMIRPVHFVRQGRGIPREVSFDPIEQLLMRFLFVFASEGADKVSEIQRLAEV